MKYSYRIQFLKDRKDEMRENELLKKGREELDRKHENLRNPFKIF
jgi:hypothetical protein